MVVIDNLDTIPDCEAVIHNIYTILGNSKILLTGRHNIRLENAFTLALGGLPMLEGITFLLENAKARGITVIETADKEQLEKIHTATGGAPLAMRLVVGQCFWKGYYENAQRGHAELFVDMAVTDPGNVQMLGAEVPNIIIAMEWCLKNKIADMAFIFAATVCSYNYGMLGLTGKWKETRSFVEAVLKEGYCPDEYCSAELEMVLSIYMMESGQNREARKIILSRLKKEKNKRKFIKPEQLLQLGIIALRESKPGRARYLYEKAARNA